MNGLRRRLGGERGEGIVSGLILLAGVLLPLLFLIPLFARIEQGRLAANQAARAAVRAAVLAPTAAQAEAAAEGALAQERAESGQPLRLRLDGSFARGSVIRARVSTAVTIASLPGLGGFGTVSIGGEASAPVDRYRSLLQAGGP